MSVDIQTQVQRLNTLIWEFQLKGFEVAASAAGRLLVKKNGRTATKTSLEQAFKKIGINALDSVADNLKAYDNDYTKFERRDGQLFQRGDTVAFLSHRARVQSFAARRGTISLLVPFKDFYIEVDPRKLTPVSGQAAEPVEPQPVEPESQAVPPPVAPSPVDDCEDVRKENAELRTELEACHSDVQKCREENQRTREEYAELPAEIVEEIPEVQREQMKEEITETLDKISEAYEHQDKPEARKQEQHLKELVREATEQVGSSTVKATTNCVVRENHVHNGIEIVFPAEPGAAVKTELKKHGFRYHRRGKYWFAKKTDSRVTFATTLCSASGEPVTSGTKTGAKKKAIPPFEQPPVTRVENGVYIHEIYSGEKKYLQAKLRQIFPGVKFTISSSTSGLRISAYDVSVADQKRIEKVVDRFGQLGFDGMTDSTLYYPGEPFIEQDGTLHRYVTVLYLFVDVKGRSATDKTSEDYRKHFADTPVAPAPDVDTPDVDTEPAASHRTTHQSETKQQSPRPPASMGITPPHNDTVYVHHLSVDEALEKIPAKLKEMFPLMRFKPVFLKNTSKLLTHVGEGHLDIFVSAATQRDLDRISATARRFSDRSGNTYELTHKSTHTAFIEGGERHRYVVPCVVRVMHELMIEEDRTSPDYIYHFSETYPMQSPVFVDLPSTEIPDSETPDSRHDTEEDFFPAPKPEPKPQPEPVKPEAQPEAQPDTEKTDARSMMAEMRELLMKAIKDKQEAA